MQGQMISIEIDADVYAALESKARPFKEPTPNDVLRRLLLADTPEQTQPDLPSAERSPAVKRLPRRPGALSRLLDEGFLAEGDPLTHTRKRTREAFRATVHRDGWIRTNGKLYASPSPALKAFVGTEIDGWANWIHEPSGKSLRELRSELDS